MNFIGKRKQISLWIPEDLIKFVRERHFQYQEIFFLGVQAKLNNPNLMKRINELEEENKVIQAKLIKHIKGGEN